MKKFLAPLFLAVFLTGCGAGIVPETGQERYIAADGAYKALLVTVQDGVRSGIIVGDNAAKVKTALNTAKIALDTWALIPENANAESAALVALQAARTVLQALRPAVEESRLHYDPGIGGPANVNYGEVI